MSELSEAINEMRNMREAYDQIAGASEAYNTGKVQLAENITAKGVQASATETLPELAGKVAQIAQDATIYEGADSYGKQIGAGGSLWDLYQVLADMKTRFMGTGDYSALIVCEYYKGYDSLQLQGADGYYTCDGDYYDYASPNHVWHDDNNGKINRWVAFLYRNEGARLDITNTAISPSSMYIGGHVGTIEYFVNGRLTDLVCGIEETDVLDNFITTNYTQSWNNQQLNIVAKKVGLPSFTGGVFLKCKTSNIIVQHKYLINSKHQYIEIEYDGTITLDQTNPGKAIVVLDCNSVNTTSPLVGFILKCRKLNTGAYVQGVLMSHNYIGQGGSGYLTNLRFIRIEGELALNSDSGGAACIVNQNNANMIALIDVYIGSANCNINFKSWNPTSVLADATQKAQLIENIKNHILARISDATGGTQLVFTISTNMYNEVASEQIEWQGETMSLADAFLTKNWLLAGA